MPSSQPAFLFPGQGAQYPNMLKGLYEGRPGFRREIDEGLEAFAHLDGVDLSTLRRALFPGPEGLTQATQFLAQTRYAQPLLYLFELALARVWLSQGITPCALFGHSIGEYPAAALAGVFTAEDGLRLVAARGRLMQALPPGGMLAVAIPVDKIAKLLSPEIALAGDNSPGQCVLSGPLPAIRQLVEELSQRSILCHPLTTSHAFHSSMMDPILPEFEQVVGTVSLKAPRIPIVSCRTGTWMTDAEATTPRSWVRQLREPVRFRLGVQTLLSTGHNPLIEVGPGRTLSSQALRMTALAKTTVVSSSRREQEPLDDCDVFNAALRACDISPLSATA